MSTLTKIKLDAINDFIKTGKAAGWYSSLKRLYLPIWADAAANAIDMISRTSGTFTATGVDHSNVGYVQGNGTSGNLTDNANANTHITSTNLFIGVLMKTAHSATFRASIGCGTADSNLVIQSNAIASTTIYGAGVGSTVSVSGTVTNNAGITSLAFNGTTRRLRLRRTNGVTLVGSNTTASAGVVSASPITIMSRESGLYTDAQIGAAFVANDNGDTTNDSFTLALKNLWETASNLTLP